MTDKNSNFGDHRQRERDKEGGVSTPMMKRKAKSFSFSFPKFCYYYFMYASKLWLFRPFPSPKKCINYVIVFWEAKVKDKSERGMKKFFEAFETLVQFLM